MKTTRQTIMDLAERYLNDADYTERFISGKWVSIVSEELNLKNLSDLELSNMWDMVYLTLDHEINYYRTNRNGYQSDINWRTKDNCPLKGKTLEETIEYYKEESSKLFKEEMKWEDVKSAFTEVVNAEARHRR